MSQIQGFCLSNSSLLPPLLFIGSAILAGKYAIQYFPGASKGGLVVTAGFASATSYSYDSAFHDIDHNYIRTLMGKTAAIAFATLCTGLTARLLNGRINISWKAAMRFAAIELIFAATISYATKESAFQKEYRHYNEYPYLWTKLSSKERTEKALTFMKAGLSAINFGTPPEKEVFPNPQTEEDWEKLSPSELSWTVCARQGNLKVETKVFLYELMQNRGIEPLRFQFNVETIALLNGKQLLIDLFYQDMVNHPQFFYAQRKVQRDALSQLFQDKAPIPPVDPKLKPHQITKMDGLLGFLWEFSIRSSWKDVPIETRSAYVRRFWILGENMKHLDKTLCAGIDINWLALLSVKEIQNIHSLSLIVCHKVMDVNQEAVKKGLSTEQLEAFNTAFKKHSLEEIL